MHPLRVSFLPGWPGVLLPPPPAMEAPARFGLLPRPLAFLPERGPLLLAELRTFESEMPVPGMRTVRVTLPLGPRLTRTGPAPALMPTPFLDAVIRNGPTFLERRKLVATGGPLSASQLTVTSGGVQ